MWQIISAFICGIISSIEVYVFPLIILNQRIRKSMPQLICAITILSIIYAILYLNVEGTIKTLTILILNIIFYKYLYMISIKKSIFIVFLFLIILIVPDLLELFFVTKVLGLSIDYCYNTFAGSIIGNISTCILTILTTYILRKPLRKLINTEIDSNTKIIILSIGILISSLTFFYTIIKQFKFGQSVIIYIFAIIILIASLFSLIKQTLDNKKLINKYDKLLEFMNSYEKEIEKIRVLRHETKNEFLTIKSKIIDKEENKEIIKYINNILKDNYKIKNEMYAKFGYLPANGIKGLCYFKTEEAENKGLNTSISISPRVEKSFIYNLNLKQNRDLGKILGVLLDNAIEGGLESKEKRFGIEVYNSLKEECEFIICNSYNKVINIEKNGKERFSTKDKNRGHGLLLVNYIIKHNNIFSIETNLINGLYVQKLKIKKPTK